jgi:hypothetical protein
MTKLKIILCNLGFSLKDVREQLFQVTSKPQTDITKY